MFGRFVWYGVFLFIVAIGSFVTVGAWSHWGMLGWTFFCAVVGSFWLPRWRDQYVSRDVFLSLIPTAALLSPVIVLNMFRPNPEHLVTWYGHTGVAIDPRWSFLAAFSFICIFVTLRYHVAEREP